MDLEAIEIVKKLPCICCTRTPVDAHHIKHRGAGGDDVLTNLLPVCRRHHAAIHQYGLLYISRKYPPLKEWLTNHGWKIDPILKKWVFSSLDL